MFTGIIEEKAILVDITSEGSNLKLTFESPISGKLKIDQSIAHNGICLTVVSVEKNKHTVVAILETIEKTTIGSWELGDEINLERAMTASARFDGHFVQGHVDQIAICEKVKEVEGSWEFTFVFPKKSKFMLIDKGSITINGVSLTVVKSKKQKFKVAIIPYTFEHTTFKDITPGNIVNIEFDVIGKYIEKMSKALKK